MSSFDGSAFRQIRRIQKNRNIRWFILDPFISKEHCSPEGKLMWISLLMKFVRGLEWKELVLEGNIIFMGHLYCFKYSHVIDS